MGELELTLPAGWIDTATRAVIVSFAVYLPSAAGFVSAFCIFEFVPAGLVRPYLKVSAMPANQFGNLDYFLINVICKISVHF